MEKAVEIFYRNISAGIGNGRHAFSLLNTVNTTGSTGGFRLWGIEFGRTITVASYPSGSAYSRIYVPQDGRFICAWPSRVNGRRCIALPSFSSDKGETWTDKRVLFYGEDNALTLANVDIIQLSTGQVLVSYRANDAAVTDGKFYSSVRVHSSEDNCLTFHPHSTVWELSETGVSGSFGLWEPYFGYLNGKLCLLLCHR